jgi:hypothetical protein
MKRFLFLVISLCITLSFFAGCNNNSQVEEPPVPIEEEFDITDSSHINWYGRVWYDEENKYMFFNNTVSGFEVNFRGTTLTAEIHAEGGARGNCFLTILVDKDIEPENAIRLELQNGTATYKLVELPEGLHTVKVLRSTEIQEAQVSALVSLETDGSFYTPPKKPGRKIEYYGASSNCGFGSLGNDADETFTTDTECGVHAFTYYTSALLKAQSSAFCASGYGLGVGGTKNLIEKYDRYTIYSDKVWDFTNYIPDVVVINLGYNDQKTFGSSGTPLYNERRQLFKTKLKEFIRNLNMQYPDAYFYVTYGIWGEYQIFDLYQECVKELNDEGRDKVIAFQLYKPVAGELGASYHANWKAHKKIALMLARDINNRLGWGEKIPDQEK